ncbi:MAG: hypothetical protein HYT71_01430 [Candidatus Aenigmarchaeota archaeon]|nr:hypothetical protein [Candidatus Aenigmarchaeota archaeon]
MLTEIKQVKFHSESRKGFGEDQVFLLVGILILVITSYMIYMLIGGPTCDDLAKRTANNIKVAVDSVATTGTYTKDSPYTTYAMLCQNKVGDPLTLNPFQYRVFSAPEYMIYWEHFPNAPNNIVEGLYKFDESYPFTKNTAQIIGITLATSFISGTFSSLKAAKNLGITDEVLAKTEGTKMGDAIRLFGKTKDAVMAPFTYPVRGIKYLLSLPGKGMKALYTITGLKGIVDDGVKYITSKTAPKIFGHQVSLGFLASMADNGLIEASNVGEELAVNIIKVTDDATGEVIEKAVVPVGRRAELKTVVDGLIGSADDAEKQAGLALKRYFAYTDDDFAKSLGSSQSKFEDIILKSDVDDKGFYGLVSGASKAAEEQFDANAKIMASRYGLYSSRPITSFFEQSGITKFSNKITATDVFRRMDFFVTDDAGKAVLKPEMLEKIQSSFKELKIQTQLTDPDKITDATGRFFTSSESIVAGAETDTAMLSYAETFLKNAKDGPATGIKLDALEHFFKGTASDDEIASISSKFSTGYLQEMKDAGVSQEIIDSASKKLSTANYGRRLLRDYSSELKLAQGVTVDTNEVYEIAKLSAAWKREPEQLALMADEKYTFIPYAIYEKIGGWSPKATSKFIKVNIESYGLNEMENNLKYLYLKSPNAGCESNTVCLNQKGVEQKKSDVSEDQVKDYETMYAVSKNVMVRLDRGGFTSPIGAGIGAFSFDKEPRFHLVSPCLAKLSVYEDADNPTDGETGRPLVKVNVDPCPVTGHSNYCYFPTSKFNEMAAGFYGSLACSIVADIGKAALFGFVLQPACSGIQIKTEYDTTWPFSPFQPLKSADMNVLNCEIQKNPKDAAKLMVTACCGLAKCDGSYVCSGNNYADKNQAICGKDKCTMGDLSKMSGLDYKSACGC